MYQIIERNNNLLQILDKYNDSIYVIKGRDKSLVIDLGMDEDPIKGLLDSKIETPYEVIVTHGHFDHVGRSGEFDSIYMSLLDYDLYLDNYHLETSDDLFDISKLSLIDVSKIREVKESYDLGDRIINIIPCPGHTPGSIIIVDQENKTVLTGDAIGSGCGVWMQVDRALSIKDYHDSLVTCLGVLKDFDVDESWLFLGGHNHQEYESKVSSFNKFDLRILEDMIILCEKLLQGELTYEKSLATEFSMGKPYYACYHKAEIIFTLSQL